MAQFPFINDFVSISFSSLSESKYNFHIQWKYSVIWHIMNNTRDLHEINFITDFLYLENVGS